MARKSRPERLRLPDTLSGDYTGIIIGSYGADLAFAEAQLFRQLSRTTVNRVILADHRQLSEYLSQRQPLKRLNRSYVACPVRSPHAHHPKFVLLVGPESGRLHVGSGNLSISGYAGPGECFTTYEWSADDPAPVEPFAAVRNLVESLMANGWMDSVTSDRVRDVFKAAPWIPSGPLALGPVVHNCQVPMIDQLADRVANRSVIEIVAAAPFHDRRAVAVAEILRRLKPQRFTLLVQDKRTRLDTSALERALAKSSAELTIIEASAPSKYPRVLLHAKFVLVRTASGDVLLQGSPNLSSVALCRAGIDANVEIANLLEGPRGEFDHVLDGLDLAQRADGLETFSPDEDWGSADDDESFVGVPRGVVWTPPQLTGLLPGTAAPALVVRVGANELTPETTEWSRQPDGHQFSFEFTETDAARIELARFIELVDATGKAWTVYPYHLTSLVRLSASGHRVDLLQETANLDLRDKELEELVAELERVLIVDGRSLWRLAHPETEEPVVDEEEVHLRYDELDWNQIGELPQLKQYGVAGQRALLAPTELGIILHSLASRFRADVAKAVGSESQVGEEDADDLGEEQQPEDPEEADDREGEDDGDDAGDARRLAPRTRVRRLWRNFVRRFVRGLSDSSFVASVGSSVIVPSYVVFNHLCRRLRVVDLVDADFLTDAQIALWSFMWGNADGPGYLASLPDSERSVAQRILLDHEDLPVTLAAVDDAWWRVWDTGEDMRPLRSAWRAFLQSPAWNPDKDTLVKAAAVAQWAGNDPDRLFEDLFDLAARTESFELDHEICSHLRVPATALRHRTDAVMRNGVRENCDYIELTGVVLKPGPAQDVIAMWRGLEPDRRYFRLESANAIAFIDLDHKVYTYFDRTTGRESTLRVGRPPVPVWEHRLEELLNAA